MDPESGVSVNGADASKWAKFQRSFLKWTGDTSVFTEEYITHSKASYDRFFDIRGLLRGNILDIGGGWGLFRQWWDPEAQSGIFVVHDPGIERYINGAHSLHRSLYQTAFGHPMTFVEGFGEQLPYHADTFDICQIAAALDHCIYPDKVCSEAYRVLRQGGEILVISTWHDGSTESTRPSILSRVKKHLLHPLNFLSTLNNWIFHRDEHLHHFSPKDIASLLQDNGFSDIRTSVIPLTSNVWAIQAIKN